MLRELVRRTLGPKRQPALKEAEHRVPLETPQSLLQAEYRQRLLYQIAAITALPNGHHRTLVLAAIERYAAFVQRLPASEAHHHAGLGGMLDHGLEVLLQALLIRRGRVLPVGAEPERIGQVHDLWTYAAVTSALLHDIGKPAVDQEVTLYDADGRRLASWEPVTGGMADVPGCCSYALRFRRGRRHRFHERVAPLLAHHIVPAPGLAWLASDPELFAAWLATISGDMDAAGPLGEIIQQADGLSVARNLGAGDVARAVPGRAKALWERLLTGLRYLVIEGELPLNRNGAAGWLVGDDLWLVSKRAIDALRAHLGTEGHTGIPSKNERIYDTLQEHGVLEACGGRAIWRATIAGDGWSHDLTMIRIRAQRIWPRVEDRPEPFDGSVTPLADVEGMSSVDTLSSGGSAETPVEQASAAPEVGGPSATGRSLPAESDSDDEFAGLPVPILPQEETAPVAVASIPAGSDSGSKASEYPGNTPPQDPTDPVGDASLDAGRRFLAWLQSDLGNRRLAVNSVQARVHVVAEGVLLVSPAIFRDFADRVAEAGAWEHVQKRFLKLKLHAKRPDGTNVHRYRVTGERHQSVIKGILIPDAVLVFGSAPRPQPNPHLKPSVG